MPAAPTRPPPEPVADTAPADQMEEAPTPQARVQQLLEQIIELAGPRAIAAAGQFANKLVQLGIIHTRPEQVPAPTQNNERVPLDPQAQRPTPQTQDVPTHTRAVVVRGVPTSRKIGKLWRWMEENNKGIGLKILRARWLLEETRRVGKQRYST